MSSSDDITTNQTLKAASPATVAAADALLVGLRANARDAGEHDLADCPEQVRTIAMQMASRFISHKDGDGRTGHLAYAAALYLWSEIRLPLNQAVRAHCPRLVMNDPAPHFPALLARIGATEDVHLLLGARARTRSPVCPDLEPEYVRALLAPWMIRFFAAAILDGPVLGPMRATCALAAYIDPRVQTPGPKTVDPSENTLWARSKIMTRAFKQAKTLIEEHVAGVDAVRADAIAAAQAAGLTAPEFEPWHPKLKAWIGADIRRVSLPVVGDTSRRGLDRRAVLVALLRSLVLGLERDICSALGVEAGDWQAALARLRTADRSRRLDRQTWRRLRLLCLVTVLGVVGARVGAALRLRVGDLVERQKAPGIEPGPAIVLRVKKGQLFPIPKLVSARVFTLLSCLVASHACCAGRELRPEEPLFWSSSCYISMDEADTPQERERVAVDALGYHAVWALLSGDAGKGQRAALPKDGDAYHGYTPHELRYSAYQMLHGRPPGYFLAEYGLDQTNVQIASALVDHRCRALSDLYAGAAKVLDRVRLSRTATAVTEALVWAEVDVVHRIDIHTLHGLVGRQLELQQALEALERQDDLSRARRARQLREDARSANASEASLLARLRDVALHALAAEETTVNRRRLSSELAAVNDEIRLVQLDPRRRLPDIEAEFRSFREDPHDVLEGIMGWWALPAAFGSRPSAGADHPRAARTQDAGPTAVRDCHQCAEAGANPSPRLNHGQGAQPGAGSVREDGTAARRARQHCVARRRRRVGSGSADLRRAGGEPPEASIRLGTQSCAPLRRAGRRDPCRHAGTHQPHRAVERRRDQRQARGADGGAPGGHGLTSGSWVRARTGLLQSPRPGGDDRVARRGYQDAASRHEPSSLTRRYSSSDRCCTRRALQRLKLSQSVGVVGAAPRI